MGLYVFMRVLEIGNHFFYEYKDSLVIRTCKVLGLV